MHLIERTSFLIQIRYLVIWAKFSVQDVVIVDAEEAVGWSILCDDLERLVPRSVVFPATRIDEHRVERFRAANLKFQFQSEFRFRITHKGLFLLQSA
jgi:hypothetical protein